MARRRSSHPIQHKTIRRGLDSAPANNTAIGQPAVSYDDLIAKAHSALQTSDFQTAIRLSQQIDNTINSKDSIVKMLRDGRTAYWHYQEGTVVIKASGNPNGGTAFRPMRGKTHFNNLRSDHKRNVG